MKAVLKYWKIIRAVLLVGSVLAAVKMIFVDYTLDEEYQLVMAYRNVTGDSLFGTMWEPHQTSAFACTWLLRLFMAVTGGTTGVLIFMRVCTTLVQALLSVWLFRVLRRMAEREEAFLLSLCYFNIIPKIIQIPEFSNLQLWFFTVIILALFKYYGTDDSLHEGKEGRPGWLAAAGLGMALEVLAYPSTVLLFPFFLVYIFVKSGEKRWRNSLLFAGSCGVCALVWLAVVLSGVSLEELTRNLAYIFRFDLTHDFTGVASGKTAALLRDLKAEARLLAIISAAGLLILAVLKRIRPESLKGKKRSFYAFLVIAVLLSGLIQLYYWVVLQKGYEEPQITLLVIALAGLCVWRFAGREKRSLFPCVAGMVITFGAVVYMSDLGFIYAIPHGMLGILFCLLLLERELKRIWGGRLGYILLISLSFLFLFGKGYTTRAGMGNTVFDIAGIMKAGPAKGILSSYMGAYIYNCNYEDFKNYVEEGANCLIVTNMIDSPGTTPYLFQNLNICHFSIVDPTSYDERLLEYWALYPHKQPDVIVVDCWYGQLMEPEDNWIMRYIENDFGYTQVDDGRYVRFYSRRL